MAISAQLKKLYASAPLDDEFYETLELKHPRFSKIWYITSSPVLFKGFLEDGKTEISWEPIPFTVKLPGNEHGGRQDLQLTISNVDRVFIDELELANKLPQNRVEVVYRVYTKSNLKAPAATPMRLSVTDVAASNETIDAVATKADVLNHPFPSLLYTPLTFPGLDR
jgi:hypothetical protein